jgi:hypothetical protein
VTTLENLNGSTGLLLACAAVLSAFTLTLGALLSPMMAHPAESGPDTVAATRVVCDSGGPC